MGKPRIFHLHFNRFGVKRQARDVWTIHRSDRCIQVRAVEVKVPVTTVYKGDTAPQPRAYLKGRGVVHLHADGTATIGAQ